MTGVADPHGGTKLNRLGAPSRRHPPRTRAQRTRQRHLNILKKTVKRVDSISDILDRYLHTQDGLVNRRKRQLTQAAKDRLLLARLQLDLIEQYQTLAPSTDGPGRLYDQLQDGEHG